MGDSARTVTELYQALRPLILRDVAAVAAPAAAGGGMAAHALNGPYHSGSLAEGQAPWAATKVELVAHAALPDVHHATATAGNSGISIAGQAISLAAAAAGAGLGYAAGVLSVNVAGLGLSVASDAVTLTSSSNPGAAASILASTASGGLTLQSLAVQGSVDITNNGDLTVAGSGAYAGSSVLFVDSSGGNVGIMGAPDPQFALDIVGPCRASWFIGPHAIQLKDVLLLSHFDGRQPFETNYTGEKNGHMGQVATVAGGVIHRPGKFGTKAVQLAEATTNLCTNPSFETGTTGWSAYTSGGGAGSIAQSATEAYVGTYSLRVIKTSTGTDRYGASFQASVTSGTAYTFSAWVKVVSGGSPTLTIGEYITSGNTANFTPAPNEWTHITISATANATGTGTFYIWANDIGVTFYIDGVQIEAKAYATPYCDGTLGGYSAAGAADGTGHSWSGTAHASTSSRLAAGMRYPTAGNINLRKGTVMAWVYLHQVTNVAEVLRITGSSAGYIILRVQSGACRGYWGTGAIAGGTVAIDTWTHLAMVYDGTTLTVYVNGVEVASGASSGFSGMPATMYVGTDGSASYANGKIEDLVIAEGVLDADGVRAVYESDAPVFAESSRFSFRATPQGLVWADDEGLWMRNSTGGTVLGAYGGAATKSWGGLTLDPSDVVIGDSARGAFLRWDDSAGTLQLGKTGSTTTSLYLSGTDLSFRVNATERVSLTGAGVLSIKDSGGAAVFTFDASAGAEFTKPLTIGTSGGVYQGTGTFDSPTAGLKVLNSSGIGQIAIYDGGVKTMRVANDDIRYVMATAFNDIRTIKWLDNVDFSGTWSDLSTTNGNYAYMGAYNTSSVNYLYLSSRVNNTGSPANTRYSSIWLVPSRNEGGTVYTSSLALFRFNSTYSYEGAALFSDMYVNLGAITATPTRSPDSSGVQMYVKGSYFVLRYNDGGTIRYKYLNMSSTGTTWTHSTTAP